MLALVLAISTLAAVEKTARNTDFVNQQPLARVTAVRMHSTGNLSIVGLPEAQVCVCVCVSTLARGAIAPCTLFAIAALLIVLRSMLGPMLQRTVLFGN